MQGKIRAGRWLGLENNERKGAPNPQLEGSLVSPH